MLPLTSREIGDVDLARLLRHGSGLCHGRQINYTAIACETGVSAGTESNYFEVLNDTLLGFTLEPLRRPGAESWTRLLFLSLPDSGSASAGALRSVLQPEVGVRE